MKDRNDRFPSCVPLWYRAYCKLRKAKRQALTRLAESTAKRKLPVSVTPDGEVLWSPKQTANPVNDFNKSAYWIDEDLERPELKAIVEKMEAMKKDLQSKGLRFTNTAATFLPRMFYPRSERTKTWENVWTIYHSNVKAGHRALDIGGASTPFSFYLASMGCSVAIVDNDWGNCGTLYNTDYVGRKMGWDIKAYDKDVSRRLPFPDKHFDHVFSICTIEHLPTPVRMAMMSEVGRVLKPGGIASITFCWDTNHRVLTVDKGLRFAYREKFMNDLVRPSGLDIYGNREWIDFEKDSGFLGAIFLRKA